MRIAWTLLWLLCVAGIRADDPRDTIVIDLKREWHVSGFAPGKTKVADDAQMSLSGEFPSFSCNEPGSRGIWQYDFDLPIEMTTYPSFVMKYRAKNIDTNNTLTCIWINEGKNRAFFPLIDFEKLTVDGQEHEIAVDLPSAPTGSAGTPFESGPINGLLVAAMNTEAGKGTIELISVEFRSATEPPKPLEQDPPIRVKILDSDQRPIKDAQVTVDGERKLAMRDARSDADGVASVTPMKNELQMHALHVEARGYMPIDMQVDQTATDVTEIRLPKSMQVGGFVVDEQGKPIKNVTVRAITPLTPEFRNARVRMNSNITVHTDAQGQWLSPPLPYSDHVYLRLNHPDYIAGDAFKEDPAILDELRSGIATIVLKK
jgi:hypothetical protein